MNAFKDYKESLIKEKDEENEYKENGFSKLLSIDIQLDENTTKKFEVNTIDELDKKLNLFCEENNLSESAKKYIYDLIMEKMNQNPNECKYTFYI